MEDKILARIRGLLAKAEGTSYPEEADTYTAKAIELMAKYGIDEALATAARGTGPTVEDVEGRRVDLGNPYSYEKLKLINAVAASMGCKSYYWRLGKNYTYTTLVGFPSDLDRVELLYTSLLIQMTRQVLKQRPPGNIRISVLAYRKAWCIGFANAVRLRLQEAQKSAVQEASGPSTDLVLVTRKGLVDQKAAELFPPKELEKPRKARFVSAAGYNSGRTAGERADIGSTRIGESRKAVR